jgi:hypothetical protein
MSVGRIDSAISEHLGDFPAFPIGDHDVFRVWIPSEIDPPECGMHPVSTIDFERGAIGFRQNGGTGHLSSGFMMYVSAAAPGVRMMMKSPTPDRLGAPIYEGDIVDYLHDGKKLRCPIRYRKGTFLIDDFADGIQDELRLHGDDVEVVGNEHEPPKAATEEAK